MQAGSERRVILLGSSMAALIVGQMIAAKATRDALFLTSFDVRLLPRMIVVAAIVSAVVTLTTTRFRVRSDPRKMTGVLAVIAALLLAGFYVFAERSPQVVAALFYLHTMSLGPLMASGFWSVINESLDPRSAKSAVTKISAGGTVGAVVGGLIAERVGAAASVETVLLFLVGANLLCVLALPLFPRATSAPTGKDASKKSGAIDAVMGDPFLRSIAVLVVLTVTGAALLDYALKAEAVEAFGGGEPLLRFFAWYYVATSAISFLLQLGAGRWFIKKLGVVRTVATLPLGAVVAGGLGLALGGIIAATVARGLEQIVRSSLYRSGYELLYTPVAPAQKRAGKPLIEIVIDRSAEAVAGGIISLFVWALPGRVILLCFAGASLCGLVGYLLVRRLQSGYVGALADQLESLPEIPAAAVLVHEGTLTIDGRGGLTAYMDLSAEPSPAPAAANPRVVTLLTGLLSSDIEIVRRTLNEARPLDERLIAAVIPLLDDKEVKKEATAALTEVAERHVGQLADVIADRKNTHYRLRARVAHLLGQVQTQRAVEALTHGLDDPRFEVRLASGRGLLAIRKAGVALDRPERFYAAAQAELTRLAESAEPKTTSDLSEADDTFASLMKDRSERTTEHVFRLFALVLPEEPVERALKGLLAEERVAQGTALEYLENVLPPDVWAALAPVIDQ